MAESLIRLTERENSMTIPKKIKVGGLTYKVLIVDQIDGDDASGITDPKTLTIKIIKCHPNVMEQTFIHELLHAINFEKEQEEVEFLSMSLYQVIKDNPKLFNRLSKKEEKV